MYPTVVGLVERWTVLMVMATSCADVVWDVTKIRLFGAGSRRLAGWFATNPWMYVWRLMRVSFAGRIRRLG